MDDLHFDMYNVSSKTIPIWRNKDGKSMLDLLKDRMRETTIPKLPEPQEYITIPRKVYDDNKAEIDAFPELDGCHLWYGFKLLIECNEGYQLNDYVGYE